jgi:hypothetical protein
MHVDAVLVFGLQECIPDTPEVSAGLVDVPDLTQVAFQVGRRDLHLPLLRHHLIEQRE